MGSSDIGMATPILHDVMYVMVTNQIDRTRAARLIVNTHTHAHAHMRAHAHTRTHTSGRKTVTADSCSV